MNLSPRRSYRRDKSGLIIPEIVVHKEGWYSVYEDCKNPIRNKIDDILMSDVDRVLRGLNPINTPYEMVNGDCYMTPQVDTSTGTTYIPPKKVETVSPNARIFEEPIRLVVCGWRGHAMPSNFKSDASIVRYKRLMHEAKSLNARMQRKEKEGDPFPVSQRVKNRTDCTMYGKLLMERARHLALEKFNRYMHTFTKNVGVPEMLITGDDLSISLVAQEWARMRGIPFIGVPTHVRHGDNTSKNWIIEMLKLEPHACLTLPKQTGGGHMISDIIKQNNELVKNFDGTLCDEHGKSYCGECSHVNRGKKRAPHYLHTVRMFSLS